MESLYAYADQIKVYKALLDATAEVQKYLRYHSGKFRKDGIIKWRVLMADIRKVR